MMNTNPGNGLPDPSEDRERHLLDRLRRGDETANAELFMLYRPRLKRMVALRMDRRLLGRIDESDVVQEAFLDYSKRATEYVHRDDIPFFLWVRMITGQKLLEIHRRHLAVQARDVRREARLHVGPEASAVSLATRLVGNFTTASTAARLAEVRAILQSSLAKLREEDREILALRHFEELTNHEIASILGLSDATASARYFGALKRLRTELTAFPGILDA
ncbi:MAG: sigma-70 family RNA polymerase sigma factor [Planctomycetota bacterium]